MRRGFSGEGRVQGRGQGRVGGKDGEEEEECRLRGRVESADIINAQSYIKALRALRRKKKTPKNSE